MALEIYRFCFGGVIITANTSVVLFLIAGTLVVLGIVLTASPEVLVIVIEALAWAATRG
jgi:hypothetical protein